MQIVNKKVDELIPYKNNPRNNDEAIPYVTASIKEFGFKNPIIIDKDNVIVAGHTRLASAKELGMEEVPCIIADDLTDEQIKAFRLADNKVAEKSLWDFNMLDKEIEELSKMEDVGFDLKDFGFSDFELSMVGEDMEPDGYDDDMIKEYSDNGQNFLKNERIIIVYRTPEEEAFLKELVKEEHDRLNVTYDAKNIMEKYDNE